MELESVAGFSGGLNKGGREMLTGYKTTLGAAGLVLMGLAKIFSAVSGDMNTDDLTEGAGLIAAGLAAFGIGSKIERK